MMLNTHSLPVYLYFGYLPQSEHSLSFIPERRNKGEKHGHIHDSVKLDLLIADGIKKLNVAFDNSVFKKANSHIQVLPLSGGMDSRAILGGLLNHFDRSQIQTVTFGIPKSYDFEIGQLVARTAGVQNEVIDLSSVLWDTEKLVQFAARCERPIPIFEAYLFDQIRIRFGTKHVYWSGFMGDALSGLHVRAMDSNTWEQAVAYFIKRNRFSRSINLVPAYFRPEDVLPRSSLLDRSRLSYDEQLDFAIREQCYFKPLVLLKGYEYRTPFLHPEWVNFILSVPRPYRKQQYIYKKILKKAYPKLFSLPIKNNFGLPFDAPRWKKQFLRQGLRVQSIARRFFPNVPWVISPMTNYIDFDLELRKRQDLKNVVYENIQDLKKRDIIDWINIDEIWRRHQRRKTNHADALILLASLEINLKAQEKTI